MLSRLHRSFADHSWQTLVILLAIVGLGLAALFALPFQPTATPAMMVALPELPPPATQAAATIAAAATSDLPLTGWAWSSNIGWISFNCKNYFNGTIQDNCSSPKGSNYKVVLNNDNLSGYAWSSNIGWIQFGGNSGCPGLGSCDAKLSGNKLVGWAKALAGGTAQAGGWDGWISLNCANTGTCATVDYSVTKTNLAFSGFVWGGDVVGWIDFDPTVPGDSTTTLEQGQCDNAVNRQVCLENPGSSDLLAVSCTVTDSNDSPVNSVPINTPIIWKANGSGGSGPPYNYTYSWSGAVSGSTQTISVPLGYSSPNTYTANVVVNDGSNTANDLCQVSVYDPNTIVPVNLQVTPGYGTITIRNQVSGQPASSVVGDGVLAAQITNTGGPGKVSIDSIKSQSSSKPLSEIIGVQGGPKCQFQIGTDYNPSLPFDSCNSFQDIPLATNDSIYLRIQVPYLKAIADNNAYLIKITAKNSDNNPSASSATIIFDYLVGTFDQI